MLWLAVQFAISGIAIFFMAHTSDVHALDTLSGMDAHAVFPKAWRDVHRG